MHRAIALERLALALAVLIGACDTCPDTAPDNGGVLLAPEGNCSQGFSKYQASPFAGESRPWAPGQDIDVKNPYGSVRIQVGGIDDARVSVTLTAFVRALWEDDARRRLKENRDGLSDFRFLTADQQGNLVIDVTSDSDVHYDVWIDLPKNFDGALTVTADQDDIEYWLWNSTSASSAKLVCGNGDIVANFSKAGNFAIQANAEHGLVSFGSTFKDVTLSADRTSGTAVIGNGAGSLEARSGHGNITFKSIN